MNQDNDEISCDIDPEVKHFAKFCIVLKNCGNKYFTVSICHSSAGGRFKGNPWGTIVGSENYRLPNVGQLRPFGIGFKKLCRVRTVSGARYV